MNTAEVLLVLVGIPLVIIAVLALLTLPGGRKRSRYKPGQPWPHAPVWYEPHPRNGGSGGHMPAPSQGPAAVPGSSTSALGSSIYPEQTDDRSTHTEGSSAASGAPRRVNAGPLGGARGTW